MIFLGINNKITQVRNKRTEYSKSWHSQHQLKIYIFFNCQLSQRQFSITQTFRGFTLQTPLGGFTTPSLLKPLATISTWDLPQFFLGILKTFILIPGYKTVYFKQAIVLLFSKTFNYPFHFIIKDDWNGLVLFMLLYCLLHRLLY